jgi:predicted metal-dependent peptidase
MSTQRDPDAALDTGKLLAARHLAVAACPYLATALHAMTVVPTYLVPTMGVDPYWRCYVSPAFVAATDVRDLAVVWLHEVAHLIRDHHGRAQALQRGSERRRRQQLRLNLAMDCEINDDLLDGLTDADGRPLSLPEGAVTPGRLGLRHYDLFEEYAAHLPPIALVGDVAWLDCGSGAHAGSSPWEHDEAGAHPLGTYEREAIRIRVREAVNSRRGTVPKGWQRWAEGVSEPSQDWRALLGAALRACMAAGAGAADYSYQRPSRRAPSLGGAVILPSLRFPVPKIAVVVDTSGSVADTDLGSALSEVGGISRAVGVRGNRVSVYSCDAAVHTVQQICATEEISLVGGGGTDLRRGIGRAAAAAPRPDVIVVLTDGVTPWPASPPGCRLIAGIFGHPSRYSEHTSRVAAGPPEWAQTVYLR